MKNLINKLFKTHLNEAELEAYRNKIPMDNFDLVWRANTYDYLNKPLALA